MLPFLTLTNPFSFSGPSAGFLSSPNNSVHVQRRILRFLLPMLLSFSSNLLRPENKKHMMPFVPAQHLWQVHKLGFVEIGCHQSIRQAL